MSPDQYLNDNLPNIPEDYRWEISYFLNRGFDNGYRIEISLRRNIGGVWHLGYDEVNYPLIRSISSLDVELGEDMLSALLEEARRLVSSLPEGVDKDLEFLRAISRRYKESLPLPKS